MLSVAIDLARSEVDMYAISNVMCTHKVPVTPTCVLELVRFQEVKLHTELCSKSPKRCTRTSPPLALAGTSPLAPTALTVCHYHGGIAPHGHQSSHRGQL